MDNRKILFEKENELEIGDIVDELKEEEEEEEKVKKDGKMKMEMEMIEIGVDLSSPK